MQPHSISFGGDVHTAVSFAKASFLTASNRKNLGPTFSPIAAPAEIQILVNSTAFLESLNEFH